MLVLKYCKTRASGGELMSFNPTGNVKKFKTKIQSDEIPRIIACGELSKRENIKKLVVSLDDEISMEEMNSSRVEKYKGVSKNIPKKSTTQNSGIDSFSWCELSNDNVERGSFQECTDNPQGKETSKFKSSFFRNKFNKI